MSLPGHFPGTDESFVAGGGKEIPIAYLFWFLLGPMGGHKFYLGEVGWGLLYLFTGGLFFVGWFIDLFTIPAQVRCANRRRLVHVPLPERLDPVLPEMNLRSTFPIDEQVIARKALTQILMDPITWVPLVPAVAAYTIFDVPAAISLTFASLVLGGVGVYWRRQWADVTNALRRKIVTDHNRAQDIVLKRTVDDLRLNGAVVYACKLEPFLITKQQIEQRIHEEGAMTAQKMQIEQLIDALCFGVRDQLATLATKERNREPVDRQAVLAQVDTAFATLQSTASDINLILGPGGSLAGSESISLEEITERLREEAEIARRVQARLRGPESEPAASEPPRMESQ